MERIILHCDCNSFFASVELLSYPALREVPVAVSGSSDNRHGIILAKNDAAKKYGVQTAETIWSAMRKCPQLKLLPPHHEKYSAYSKAINAIYARFTDRVEPFGIDESWLDLTHTWHLFGDAPLAVANHIRETVKAETLKLYQELLDAGVDVMLDDRGERPGVMFADWELIGVPHRVVLSERGIAAGECEYQHRRDTQARKLPLAEIAAFLRQQLAA